MNNFQTQMRYAVRTGRCPVCHKRKRAHWKDTGDLRMTCGHPACFAAWLPGKKQHLDDARSNTLQAHPEEVN